MLIFKNPELDKHSRQTATDPHWLTHERLVLYSRAFFMAQIIIIFLFILAECLFSTKLGESFIGNDFRVFWSASYLKRHFQAVTAYDIDSLFSVQKSISPWLKTAKPWQYWFYPPTFLFTITPLSWLPYWPSFAAFNVFGLTLYLWTLRKISPCRETLLIALAFPALQFIILNGQNSFISASLAGLALVWLERKPSLSGVAIGLLIIKPQLAILFIPALLFSRQWKVFSMAALTATIFLAVSVLNTGIETIPAFFRGLQIAKIFANEGLMPLAKMPTIFVAARLLGMNTYTANIIHFSVAIIVGGFVCYLWNNDTSTRIRNSALIIGSLMITPHLFDYDLVWLAWPIAWMTLEGIENGWYSGERELLTFAWISPLICSFFGLLHLQVVPFILMGMLGFLVKRTHSSQTHLIGRPKNCV